jgi:hypothetical protein
MAIFAALAYDVENDKYGYVYTQADTKDEASRHFLSVESNDLAIMVTTIQEYVGEPPAEFVV